MEPSGRSRWQPFANAAVYVTTATAALLVLLSFAGLLGRWRSASHGRAEIEAQLADKIEAETLEQAA